MRLMYLTGTSFCLISCQLKRFPLLVTACCNRPQPTITRSFGSGFMPPMLFVSFDASLRLTLNSFWVLFVLNLWLNYQLLVLQDPSFMWREMTISYVKRCNIKKRNSYKNYYLDTTWIWNKIQGRFYPSFLDSIAIVVMPKMSEFWSWTISYLQDSRCIKSLI